MDNELPAEVLDRLKAEAKSKAGNTIEEQSAWFTCATEYATKLLQVEQENKELKDQIENYVLDGRDRDFKGRALLEKFISRHEAGLLPDMFIYNEIKTFLDGTK